MDYTPKNNIYLHSINDTYTQATMQTMIENTCIYHQTYDCIHLIYHVYDKYH